MESMYWRLPTQEDHGESEVKKIFDFLNTQKTLSPGPHVVFTLILIKFRLY